jgi:hypothetical protein
MSRLFDISWTERSFLLIFAFLGSCLYALTAIGLYYRIPLAGFLVWFIFIGPGVAEFTHFIFPLLKPALDPTLPAAITATVSNGRLGRRDAELLDRRNRSLLLSRPAHSRTPDDSRYLRDHSPSEWA